MSRTGIFASAKGAILGQTLSLLSSGIKVMPLTSLYVPDYAAHTTMSDVPSGARVVAGVALANKSLVQAGTGYRFDADDTTFGGIPNPTTIAGVVMYLDGGSDGASKLIGYFDYFVNTPRLVVGGTVTFSWPPAGIFVLDDGVLGGPQGTSGSLTSVQDDIAKHTGTAIDTVQGILGIPIRGTRGATPLVGAVPVYNSNAVGGAGYEKKKPVRPGEFDVTNYGAIGDGTTDCAAAIEAAIAASAEGAGQPQAGAVFFPPGTYYCSRSVDVYKQAHLHGACYAGDYTRAIVRFAAGCGFVLHSRVSAAAIGYDGVAASATVSDLRIISSYMGLSAWQASHAYSLGARVRVANDNRYFWECTVAGTSGTIRPFRDEIDPISGQVDNGKQLGVSVTDGGVSWICKVHSAVTSYTQCQIRRLKIEGFSGPCLTLFGAAAVAGSNVNGSMIEEVYQYGCGTGVMICGNDDANSILILRHWSSAAGLEFPSETGGFGFVSDSFLGVTWQNYLIEEQTGMPIFCAHNGGAVRSTFLNGYVEGSAHTSKLIGLVLGGDDGSGIDPTQYVTGFREPWWYRIWTRLDQLPTRPVIRWDEPSQSAFHWRHCELDPWVSGLGERFSESGSHQGWWYTSSQSANNGLRRIAGYSQRQAVEGAHHKRVNHGEFRGDGTTPYYVGYNTDAKTDPLVRFGVNGVGGHFKVGDRIEKGDGTIGEICITEGYDTSTPWSASLIVRVWHEFLRLTPTTVVHPSTPNGYVYACTKPGTTSASTEPTWPTSPITGAPHYHWVAGREVVIGDYAVPSTRNGHYYKATAISSPDAFGWGHTGGSEPTWPTGSGATVVDNGITWTEQGSDTGTYVVDGTTEWQCIGAKPLWKTYGATTFPLPDAFIDLGSGSSHVETASEVACPRQYVTCSGSMISNRDLLIESTNAGDTFLITVDAAVGASVETITVRHGVGQPGAVLNVGWTRWVAFDSLQNKYVLCS